MLGKNKVVECRTCVWILSKTEAFGAASLRVVDEAESLDLASVAKDVGDLFLGKSCRKSEER